MRGVGGPVGRLGLIAMLVVLGYSAGRVAIFEGEPRLVHALGVGATEAVLAALALVLTVVGFLWVRRITSGEPDPHAWRSRDRSQVRIQEPIAPAAMRPEVRQAQETARLMLAFVLGLPLVALFLWIASPGGFEPMFGPPWYVAVLPWLGAAGYLVGLGWMIRIYRARPEGGERTWRYRAMR
jgi:hypothetical protein